jgi:GNAT superfamily N-acetyltransferase
VHRQTPRRDPRAPFSRLDCDAERSARETARRRERPPHYHRRLTAEPTAIRACRTEDVPLVLGLWEQARSEHATTPDRPEDLERLVLRSPEALLLAESNRKVAGVLIAAWDGWRGNLYRLAVHPGHRRNGVGLALVRAGEEHLRPTGRHESDGTGRLRRSRRGRFLGLGRLPTGSPDRAPRSQHRLLILRKLKQFHGEGSP